LQQVDFTTLTAICRELRQDWLPARLEQVYQCDRYTVQLGLRTLDQRSWLSLCWHPQAARLCLADPPPRIPDTFTFSQQLRHQLQGLALVSLEPIAPWERVIDLQFAQRPGEPALWHLYVEVMGKYSNLILTNAEDLIVTAAHQVSRQQSRVRPIQTGQPYFPPPGLLENVPSLSEPELGWQQRVALIPGPLQRQLLQSYRGLSSTLVKAMLVKANLDPQISTVNLTPEDWHRLYQVWQSWLWALQNQDFRPGGLAEGYTVLGWGIQQPAHSVQSLIHEYYQNQCDRQEFTQLQQQLNQKLQHLLAKLRHKAQDFSDRLTQADAADQFRQQADLLMAHLQHWQPGMTSLELPDFSTGQPVKLTLDPQKNAIQNAQRLYKRHQKLKRTRANLEPLEREVEQEIQYLEQVEAAVLQCVPSPGQPGHRPPNQADLLTLMDIREELVQQNYLAQPETRRSSGSKTTESKTDFLRYPTPGGLELWMGRNNRQNDQLTFRLAGEYDLWFHAQEIAGSHVLLRSPAGTHPQAPDLQMAANFAAYYSRSRQSNQVPVIYTQPKSVYKPKGAKPGIAVYKHEQVIWGYPQQAEAWLQPKEIPPA
jgi:predicted ribosome quality control (RQC) complex YloA/Tae2 family protein